MKTSKPVLSIGLMFVLVSLACQALQPALPTSTPLPPTSTPILATATPASSPTPEMTPTPEGFPSRIAYSTRLRISSSGRDASPRWDLFRSSLVPEAILRLSCRRLDRL